MIRVGGITRLVLHHHPKKIARVFVGVRHCAAEHQMYSERSESYDAPFIKLPAITVPWQKKPASPRPHTQTSALALKGHYALTQQEGKSIKRDRYKKQANISNKHWFTCTCKRVQSVVNSLDVASLPFLPSLSSKQPDDWKAEWASKFRGRHLLRN